MGIITKPQPCGVCNRNEAIGTAELPGSDGTMKPINACSGCLTILMLKEALMVLHELVRRFERAEQKAEGSKLV